MRTSMLWQMTLTALAYLRGRKLRTVLTILSIIFGVALIFSMNLILPSAKEAFTRMISTTSGAADISMTSVTGESFPSEPLNTAATVKGVQAVTGILSRTITLPGQGASGSVGTASQLQLTGIDPATIGKVRDIVISDGRALNADDKGKVLVPSTIASIAPQLKVGASFPLITAAGLRFYSVVGLFTDQGKLTTPQIILPLADAQAAFNQPGLINAIDIKLEPGADRDSVLADVQKALGGGFQPASSSNAVDAVTSLQATYAIFNVLGVLALFMGGFLIFNTFRTLVVERRHDLGMLRAIGAQRSQLTQMIIVEGLLQGIIGTGLGLLVGYAFAQFVAANASRFYSSFISGLNLYITLNAQSLLIAITLGILTTLVAAYFPARAASRTSPLEALRPASLSNMRRAARWGLIAGLVLMLLAILLMLVSKQSAAGGAILFLIGVVLIAPSLVTPMAHLFSPILSVWFAREGDLASGNLTRQPGRAAITASTLMIGFAVFIAIAAIVGSFNVFITNMVSKNFVSDILILPPTVGVYGGIVGVDSSLTSRLSALPEADTVAGLRYASSTLNGQTIQVLGIDPNAYPKTMPLDFSAGNPSDAYNTMLSGRAAILTTIASSTLKVKVGDTVKLQTANGIQDYQVVGLANDLLSYKVATAYISQANMASDFHKAEDVLLMINLKPNVAKAAALKSVREVLKDYPQFNATLTSEYRDTLMGVTISALNIMNIMSLVILFPAVLGLLNTLTINVIERTREIGIIRAVGGSRKQVRRIVTAEAILLGLFGATIGILAGIALSYGLTVAISTVGWAIPYVFPAWALVLSIIGGLLLALAAAILPARNAAQMDIIRALQYE